MKNLEVVQSIDNRNSPEIIRLLIAEDHAVVRRGLIMVLSLEPDIVICGEAADGQSAVETARKYKPNLCLLDYKMPYLNGVQAGREIKAFLPECKILILTGIEADQAIFSALESGIDGYVLKEVTPDELLQAIRTVARGEAYLHPIVTRKVLERMARQKGSRMGNSAGAGAGDDIDTGNIQPQSPVIKEPLQTPPSPSTSSGILNLEHLAGGDQSLSEREREVLLCMALGQTNREIGEALVVGEETVRTHIKSIFRKLGVNDRTKAAIAGIKRNLISLE